MDRRQLASDLADAVREAEEIASRAVWAALEPLIRSAWSAALNPRVVLGGGADDTALRSIAAKWEPPPEVGALITDLHTEGGLTALAGFFSDTDAATGYYDPLIFDHAAVSYLHTATNRLVGIGDSTWGFARDRLSEYMSGPQTREDAKGFLEKALFMSEYRADTVARTEMGAAANEGAMFSGTTLKAAGFDVTKQWFAQGDARTRRSHADADGQEVLLDEPFSVGGVELMQPGDPMGPAEEVVNCRCTVLMTDGSGSSIAVDEDMDPEEMRDAFDQARDSTTGGVSERALRAEAQLRRTGEEIDAVVQRRMPELADMKARMDAAYRIQLHAQQASSDAFQAAATRMANADGFSDWRTWWLDKRDEMGLGDLRGLMAEKDAVYRQAQATAEDTYKQWQGARLAYNEANRPGRYLDELRSELESRGIGMGRDNAYAETATDFRTRRTRSRAFPNSADYRASSMKGLNYYPTSWNRLTDEAFGDNGGILIGPISGGPGARGWHTSIADGHWALLSIPSSRRTDIGLFVHEWGHHMEDVVPGLKGAEWTFRARRAGPGALPESMNRLAKGHGYGKNERAFADDFINPYMGKVYGLDPGANTEVMTMGMEGLYRNQWGMIDEDADYRHFIVGLLATLGRVG